LLGEDETDKEVLDNKRSFAAQPVGKKIAVVVAGVVMNLLLAWLLFYIVLGAQGFKTKLPLLSDYKFAGINQSVETAIIIGNIAKDSPAEKAGLKDGDRLIGFNGSPVIDTGKFVEDVKAQAGKEINLTVSDIQNFLIGFILTKQPDKPTKWKPVDTPNRLADFLTPGPRRNSKPELKHLDMKFFSDNKMTEFVNYN
jgi:membrane-associated protease RseP (regulator of RpoE activity)